MLAATYLTFLPGHTSHSKGRGPSGRNCSLGAAGIQPLASSAAGIRTTQYIWGVQTIHAKPLRNLIKKNRWPTFPSGTMQNEKNMVIRIIPTTDCFNGKQRIQDRNEGVLIISLLLYTGRLCVCVYHVLGHDEEMLLFLVQDEVWADGCVLLYGDDRVLFNLTIGPQEHLQKSHTHTHTDKKGIIMYQFNRHQ